MECPPSPCSLSHIRSGEEREKVGFAATVTFVLLAVTSVIKVRGTAPSLTKLFTGLFRLCQQPIVNMSGCQTIS